MSDTDSEVFAELVGIAEHAGFLLAGVPMEAIEHQTDLSHATARGDMPSEDYYAVLLRRLRLVSKRLDQVLEEREARPIYEWVRNTPRRVE